MHDIYNIDVKTIDGHTQSLEAYKNKNLLIVNVASKCGFTKQYADLEKLYQQYKDKDFVILAFPCNQFANQEPGNEAQIKQFCQSNYQVSFPLFAKIKVNGAETHTLYQHLKREKPGIFGNKRIKWNFTKFIIDKKGNVVRRFAPQTSINKINKVLANMSDTYHE